MPKAWADRYLALLKLQAGPPTLHNLEAIAAAHRGVVFQNASSLMRKQATPEGPVPAVDAETFLQTWERDGPGGVCFEVATMASELLSTLGYDVCVVIGEIAFRGHQAVIVSLGSSRYLLDLGNGAPLFEPIPLDQPYETDCAGLRYRFSRDEAAGQHLQERWINGAWQPFARYDLTPANPEERASSYQRHHSLPATGFVMGSFTLVRCLPDEVLQLRDHTFTRHKASGKTSREVRGLADYEALIRDTFALPLFPVEQSLKAWVAVTGATI